MMATRFMRQPFYVTGIEVTSENMEAVARWCQGHVIRDGDRSFIRVPVDRATNRRQTEAYVGLWVTASKQRGLRSFKVYTREWLDKNFFELSGDDELDSLEIEDLPLMESANVGGEGSRPSAVATTVTTQFQAPPPRI